MGEPHKIFRFKKSVPFKIVLLEKTTKQAIDLEETKEFLKERTKNINF